MPRTPEWERPDRIEKIVEARSTIREALKEGLSGNQIVSRLRESGLSYGSRQRLLGDIREMKGAPKKPDAEKHIPTKYKESAAKKKEEAKAGGKRQTPPDQGQMKPGETPKMAKSAKEAASDAA